MSTDSLRDRYYRKEIFNVGDIVESNGDKYRIKKRGANHLIVESVHDKSIVLTKWIDDVIESSTDNVINNESHLSIARTIARAVSFPGFTEYRNPVSLIEDSIEYCLEDESSKYYTNSIRKLIEFAVKSGIALNEKYLSEDLWSSDIVMQYQTDDEGNLIRDVNGLPKMRKHRNVKIDFRASGSGGRPNPIANDKTKKPERQNLSIQQKQQDESLTMDQNTNQKDSISDLLNEIATATLLGKDTTKLKSQLRDVKYAIDKRNQIDRTAFFAGTGLEDYGIEQPEQHEPPNGHKFQKSHVGSSLVSGKEPSYVRKMKIKQVSEESEKIVDDDDKHLTDEQLKELEHQVKEFDHIHHVYDPNELAVIDKDTGEKIKELHEEIEVVNEVLSREERIKSALRFARMHSKLERKMMIALKKRSSTATLNKRATKLAEHLIKKKLAGGRDPATLDVSTKERVEAMMQKKRNAVKQLAMRLVSKIRKIENDRLTHHVFTKPE